MTPIPHTLRLLGASLLTLATLLALTPTASADTGRASTSTPTTERAVHLITGDSFSRFSRQCTISAVVVTADGTGGFLTPFSCGRAGDIVTAPGGTSGTIVWSSREDGVAFVQAHKDWILTPYTRLSGVGRYITITGSQEANIGTSVCRSGPTTGWRCGTIQAKNQTVDLPEGPMHGLTRTNVCVEPGEGELGTPYFSGTHHQGITVAGSGNCRTGGTTFFKPINPILHKYSLRLVTG
ncbi:streptogrisin C [Nocardiopsis mwathae]|uniref:Streptogrisin C n=1 Tax=Nocardiopsis mwathae TaxID=1472723 RepID=A0A7W9YG76_9ACTN|nr:S1 family peptidase [Nocardiopsis mwathae]MBB6171509.1 streptogrisin C [Nocardiopsis mwathae]